MVKALENQGIKYIIGEGEHGGHGFAVGFNTSVAGWIDQISVSRRTGIVASTFTKMNNEKQVSWDILAKICSELGCGLDDIAWIDR